MPKKSVVRPSIHPSIRPSLKTLIMPLQTLIIRKQFRSLYGMVKPLAYYLGFGVRCPASPLEQARVIRP
jgi:hypothetical protein